MRRDFPSSRSSRGRGPGYSAPREEDRFGGAEFSYYGHEYNRGPDGFLSRGRHASEDEHDFDYPRDVDPGYVGYDERRDYRAQAGYGPWGRPFIERSGRNWMHDDGREGRSGGNILSEGGYGVEGEYGWPGGPQATQRRWAQFGDSTDMAYGGGSPQQWRRMPKGYTRSDERIRDDVVDRLHDSGLYDLSEITVGVREGHVVLSGHVPYRSMKRRMEDLAESCTGVKDVENQIRVIDPQRQREGTEPRDGGEPQPIARGHDSDGKGMRNAM